MRNNAEVQATTPHAQAIINALGNKLKNKKILHFGSLAGWPHTLASVSRQLGLGSTNVVHAYKDVHDLDRKLPYDQAIFSMSDLLPKKIIKTLRFLKNVPREYSIVHYHGANILHREAHCLLEGPYLRDRGVRMVLSLGGGDARFVSEAREKNQFFYREENKLRDFMIALRWRSWSKNISIIATDPEMMQIAKRYFSDVVLFPQPLDLKKFQSAIGLRTVRPRVLHVPTEPKVKGTNHVITAMENLKRKGLDFEFKMVRQLTQQEFYKELSECDIYVDELLCGAHGVTAVEAMSMGKPVLTFIRDDLVDKYPEGLPIVNSSPDNVEQNLERLIVNSDMRINIGMKSRAYAERFHSAQTIVEDLAGHYLRLLSL